MGFKNILNAAAKFVFLLSTNHKTSLKHNTSFIYLHSTQYSNRPIATYKKQKTRRQSNRRAAHVQRHAIVDYFRYTRQYYMGKKHRQAATQKQKNEGTETSFNE